MCSKHGLLHLLPRDSRFNWIMKLVMKIPFFHHLFSRPISSNNFSTSNFSANTPLIHTLSSFIFLTSSTTIPTSPSPPNSQNNESHNTHFPISPYSTSQFPRAWSKSIHKFDPFPSNTHLPIFQNHSTPHHQFTHRRLFSSVRPDPSSNDPPSPNEIHVVSSVNSPFESSTSIDAGSSIRKPISLWPGMYHSPVTNALWEARSSIFEKPQEIPSDDAASGSKLVPKTPAQSRTSITYKFSSDYILREQYRNPWNEMRTGKLLEDLDALAGTISFKVLFLFIPCASLNFTFSEFQFSIIESGLVCQVLMTQLSIHPILKTRVSRLQLPTICSLLCDLCLCPLN